MKYFISKSRGQWATAESDRKLETETEEVDIITTPSASDDSEMQEVTREELIKLVPEELHSEFADENILIGTSLKWNKKNKGRKTN